MTEMNCTSTLYNTQETLVNNCSSAPLYELQEVIQQFKTHPELLKLILTSKVEEDKRRTEEAKLRAKELDYYLKHDTPPPTSFSSSSSTSSSRLSISSLSSNTSTIENKNNSIKSLISPTLPPITTTISSNRKMSISSKSSVERSVPYPSNHTRSPIHSSQQLESSTSQQLRKSSFDERRHSAAAAMVAMGSSTFTSTSPSSPKSTSSCDSSSSPSPSHLSNDETLDSSSLSASNAYPSPKAEQYEENEESESTPKPRRRREMQAITKIVETREFPYMDNYFWRNNGNTTQKKTGCRSIYYKCSNSNKNCMVNKTITERPDGVYIIKYRGTHLPICGMVERIRDI